MTLEIKLHNILVVEKNKKNAGLISSALLKFGLICPTASDYTALDDALAKKGLFEIVLMDITGFDAQIWERCKKIQEQNIPLLILSVKPNFALQQQGMLYGATGVIGKPVLLKDFVKLIFSLIHHERRS